MSIYIAANLDYPVNGRAGYVLFCQWFPERNECSVFLIPCSHLSGLKQYSTHTVEHFGQCIGIHVKRYLYLINANFQPLCHFHHVYLRIICSYSLICTIRSEYKWDWVCFKEPCLKILVANYIQQWTNIKSNAPINSHNRIRPTFRSLYINYFQPSHLATV